MLKAEAKLSVTERKGECLYPADKNKKRPPEAVIQRCSVRKLFLVVLPVTLLKKRL